MNITESHSTLWYRHLLLQCVICILHPIAFDQVLREKEIEIKDAFFSIIYTHKRIKF